jgi:hypothetical protein
MPFTLENYEDFGFELLTELVRILEIKGDDLKTWLQYEGPIVLPILYTDTFAMHYDLPLTIVLRHSLSLSATGVCYMLQTYIKMNPTYSLKRLLKYMIQYVKIQLREFSNDYEGIIIWDLETTDEETDSTVAGAGPA